MKNTRVVLICSALYGVVSHLDYEAAMVLQRLQCDQSTAAVQCLPSADAGSWFEPADTTLQLVAAAGH